MSLPHAILGFLNVMPLTGYDLKTRAFDKTVAHFWPAVLPQIYRELDKMAAKGWVESELELQESKPNRKVYRITRAGQAELARWLRSYQPPPAHREAFLIQLFFAAQLSNEEILTLLRQQRQAHQDKLEVYRAIHIPRGSGTPHEERGRTLTWLTLDLGLRHEQMYLDWLDDAIATVEAFTVDAKEEVGSSKTP
jgi:PadR family transcriptional regulator AphA